MLLAYRQVVTLKSASTMKYVCFLIQKNIIASLHRKYISVIIKLNNGVVIQEISFQQLMEKQHEWKVDQG